MELNKKAPQAELGEVEQLIYFEFADMVEKEYCCAGKGTWDPWREVVPL